MTEPGSAVGRVVVLGAHILDVLGRPVETIPAGQGSARLTEIRATAAGTGAVAVTLGADGCLITRRDGGLKHLPAIEVDVVDTTGCGDGFNAGMIAGLLLGCDRIDAAWLGLACESLVATGLGSDAGIAGLGQVLRFLRRAAPEVAARIGDRIGTHVA
jgi:sugar/nucleoside kinase (ribokinase family)